MTLTPSEAAAALATIEATETRAKQLNAYRKGSPFLLLWGAIWVVGFSVEDLAPQMTHTAWLTLDLIGGIATLALVALGRQRVNERIGNRAAQKVLALTAISILFSFATFMLLRPRNPLAGMAFAGLELGMIYSTIGVFVGTRWMITGLGLLTLTFAGYFSLTAHYGLWMAFVCGGGLILAGLWLRRV